MELINKLLSDRNVRIEVSDTNHLCDMAMQPVTGRSEITCVEDAELYLSNPDKFFADAYKITVLEYCEWKRNGGMVFCSATTKLGRGCKNYVPGYLIDSPIEHAQITRLGLRCHCHS